MRLNALITAAAGMTLLACSDVSIAGPLDQRTVVDGLLTFTVSDTLGIPGISFAKPAISVDASKIVVTNTRYGSLCLYDVTGHADITANTVTLHVTYAQRLTVCTAELRFLRYRAEIGPLPAKSYTVNVVHEENGHSEMLVTQAVTLP